MKAMVFCLFFIIGLASAYADMAPDTVFINGLEVRDERRVSMEKEKLFISKKLVSVDYDFRNTSNENVTCNVFFPTPPIRKYIFEYKDFGDFKVYCDGSPIEVIKEYRAFVNGQDVSDEIKKAGLKVVYPYIPGKKPTDEYEEAIKKISPDQLDSLQKKHIIGTWQKTAPNWEVRADYHWRQEFPFGKVIHLSLNYSPWRGYQYFYNDNIPYLCPPLKEAFSFLLKQNPDKELIKADTIDFILTTANSWQTPIKDFELTTEADEGEQVTLCWDGPIEKTNEKIIHTKKKNFIPDNELKIYFYKIDGGHIYRPN